MRGRSVQLWSGVLMSSLLAGCAGTRPGAGVRDYLEEATGSSVTHVAAPAAFVHGQPGLASSGRDYVYLAPISVSQGGQRTYWLWLGVWSTVDRQARSEAASPLKLGSLQIVADDEPMGVETQPVGSRPAGLERLPYATPVRPIQEWLVEITRTQLQRLGRARTLALVDHPDDGAVRRWRGDDRAVAVLSDFAAEVGVPRLAGLTVPGR